MQSINRYNRFFLTLLGFNSVYKCFSGKVDILGDINIFKKTDFRAIFIP